MFEEVDAFMNVISFPTYTDVPDRPGVIKVENIQSDNVSLTWSKPQRDGGTPITGYIVEKREKGQPESAWTKTSHKPVLDTTLRVPRLAEGREYEFRVSAVNKAGMSTPVATAAPVVVERPSCK